MPWIQIDDTLAGHWKVKDLATALNVSEAAATGHLVLLWLWAVRYKKDGNISGLRAEVLNMAAGWTGHPERFQAALIRCGFIDQKDGATHLHGWEEYGGKYHRALEQAAERKRRFRERDRERDGTRPGTVRNATGNAPERVRGEESREEEIVVEDAPRPTTTADVLAKYEELFPTTVPGAYPTSRREEARLDEVVKVLTPDQLIADMEDVHRAGRRITTIAYFLTRWEREGVGNGSTGQPDRFTGRPRPGAIPPHAYNEPDIPIPGWLKRQQEAEAAAKAKATNES